MEPDAIEPDRPERRTPPRPVATGLAPTAEVPTARGTDHPPAYAPCEACGQQVLLGETRAGTRLALDVHQTSYCVSWDTGATLPWLDASRAYPLHTCRRQLSELSDEERRVPLMPGKQRFSARQVIDALHETKGMVSYAAQRLQCDIDTVLNYCKRYPAVEAARYEARTELLDLAELKLWAAIQHGEGWAVQFALRSIGRDRGYGEHLALHLTIERAAARVAVNVVSASRKCWRKPAYC